MNDDFDGVTPDTSPEATLEGHVGAATDDEYFDALLALPTVLDENGEEVDVTSDVVDSRPLLSRIKYQRRKFAARRTQASGPRTLDRPLEVAPPAAVAEMSRIIERMRKRGVKVQEIAGWQTRGRDGAFTPKAVFEHHDASSLKTGNSGALGIIVAGRPGIPGPLSQFQVGRDGTWFVVAAGRANHAGLGGPKVGIPADSGNQYAYGVEVANNGVDEPYSAALQTSLDKGLASILDEMNNSDTNQLIGHKEWAPTRKSDPRHSMNWRRDRVRAVRKPAPTGDPWLKLTNPPMVGQKVMDVQHALVVISPDNKAKLGDDYQPGKPTLCAYRRKTADVIAVYKRNRNISEVGCGPQTWARLRLDLQRIAN